MSAKTKKETGPGLVPVLDDVDKVIAGPFSKPSLITVGSVVR